MQMVQSDVLEVMALSLSPCKPVYDLRFPTVAVYLMYMFAFSGRS